MSFTVRQARAHKGITQEDMAAALGVSLPTYRRYETCPSIMPSGHLDRLSRITNIPIANIVITEDREEEPE